MAIASEKAGVVAAVNIAAHSRCVLGESPLWLEQRNEILWLDLIQSRLNRLHSTKGLASIAVETLPPLGAILLSKDPSLIWLSSSNGLGLLNIDTGNIKPILNIEAVREGLIFNDAKVDRLGNMWLTSYERSEVEPRGCLYRLDANGNVALADSGFVIPNGPAFSPDNSTLYFSDSTARRILAYDNCESPPFLRNRRVFASFNLDEGLPDGLAVDTEGCVWSAHWDGWRVTRWSPAGERLEIIRLPVPRVTSLVFGGNKLKTLYITTATAGLDATTFAAAPHSGSLFKIAVNTYGLPEIPACYFP